MTGYSVHLEVPAQFEEPMNSVMMKLVDLEDPHKYRQ